MIWATVTILTPCSCANFSRSGTRAIVPSSFMISQITPAGLRAAIRERSTAASVWPARCRTPPGRARKGKTWPGMTRSSGSVASSTATLHVCARSAAEMPVETPSLASMETVKAVPMREELWVIICGISRWSSISSAIGRQMSPLPWVAMKFMSSGVTSSAAIVRSPSFSRSSSSQTITIFPALMSSMTSSIGLNGIFDAPLEVSQVSFLSLPQEPLHVFGYDIRLQVHPVSRPELPEVGVRAGLRQDGDSERAFAHRDDGEADAVDADATLLDNVAEHGLRRAELPDLRFPLGPGREDLPHAVHVPLHDVPPEPVRRSHRPLEVDRAPLREAPQRRTPQRLGHGVEGQRPAVELAYRQAHTVHRHAVADACALGGPARGDAQACHLARFDPPNAPYLFNQPGEHDPPRGLDRGSWRRPRRPSLRATPRTRVPRPSSSRAGPR